MDMEEDKASDVKQHGYPSRNPRIKLSWRKGT